MIAATIEDYTDIKPWMKGAYAGVYKAVHKPTGNIVALKKYRLDHGDVMTPMEQIRILRTLDHPNTTKLESVFVKNDTLYITEKFVQWNLMDHISCCFKGFSQLQMKHYAYQILSAIRYLHDRHIVHCAIAPQNILIEKGGHVILTDFLSAYYEGSVDDVLCPLWWRPPEAIDYQNVQIRTSLDIWSAGCVLAQMASQNPLFVAGSEQEMKELFDKFSNNPVKYLEENVPFEDHLFVDLLTAMLSINPEDRISATDALEHPYFAEIQETFAKQSAP